MVPKRSSTIGRNNFVGVGVALLEEVGFEVLCVCVYAYLHTQDSTQCIRQLLFAYKM